MLLLALCFSPIIIIGAKFFGFISTDTACICLFIVLSAIAIHNKLMDIWKMIRNKND